MRLFISLRLFSIVYLNYEHFRRNARELEERLVVNLPRISPSFADSCSTDLYMSDLFSNLECLSYLLFGRESSLPP